MTIWTPDLTNRPGPIYRAIADALADDVAAGTLAAGTRLPTHRDLAHRLGVTVTTITRAFAEAERRGLTDATVGRGTFIRGANRATERSEPASGFLSFSIPTTDQRNVIDLSLNLPSSLQGSRRLSETLAELSTSPQVASFMEYQSDLGLPHHREQAARWMGRSGLTTQPERCVITNGGQHGLLCSMLAVCNPGDVVLAEEFTYAGIKAVASHLGLTLIGLPMDDQGLIPEAVEEACRRHRPRALCCQPTLQNPTTAVMGIKRREQIAEIARRHGLYVIEDDVYGALPTSRPAPLAELLPELGVYISSASKAIAPGLRVGFIHAPAALVARIGACVRLSGWMTAPLLAEIVARWVDSGTAAALLDEQRREIVKRHEIAKRILGGLPSRSNPEGFHIWLQLPPAWRSQDLSEEMRGHGVVLIGSDAFRVHPTGSPDWIRVCIGAVANHQLLEQGLTLLRRTMETPPPPAESGMAVV